MTFEEAKSLRSVIEDRRRRATVALKAIPGVGSGPMGLTHDSVKASPEYRAAKATLDKALREEQRFNTYFTKTFAKEYKEDRRRA